MSNTDKGFSSLKKTYYTRVLLWLGSSLSFPTFVGRKRLRDVFASRDHLAIVWASSSKPGIRHVTGPKAPNNLVPRVSHLPTLPERERREREGEKPWKQRCAENVLLKSLPKALIELNFLSRIFREFSFVKLSVSRFCIAINTSRIS